MKQTAGLAVTILNLFSALYADMEVQCCTIFRSKSISQQTLQVSSNSLLHHENYWLKNPVVANTIRVRQRGIDGGVIYL
jgi:hypothetical protein